MSRIALMTPLLLLGACNVSNDQANDQVSVEYNQDLAENVAADVGNTAQDIGGIIANDVSQAADKVQNEVGDVDVDADVDVDTNGGDASANANAN